MTEVAPLRIGISGFGGSGPHAAGAFQSLPGCRVTGVYDPKPGGRERAERALPGVLLADDLDALLDSGIDVLAVCSPMFAHADQIVRALDAGKHVLCEPPLAPSADDCAAILRAARARPALTVAVQRLLRFMPLHLGMRRVVASGELGRVSYAEVCSVQDARRRLSQHDTWVLEKAPSPWLFAGFPVLDLLQWILDDPIEQVTGMASNTAYPEFRDADLCVALLRFRSGVLGRIVVAVAAGRPQDTSIRILGDTRCVENNLVLQPRGPHALLARPQFPKQPASGSLRRRAGALWRALRFNLGVVAGHRLAVTANRLCHPASGYSVSAYPFRLHEHGLALASSVAEFVSDVRAGRAPRNALAESAEVVAASLACAEACRTGRTVSVSEFFADRLDAGTGRGGRS